MNISIFFWPLTLLLLFVFQIAFSQMLSLWGAFPNLLLLGTIFFAIRRGPITGEWIGFIWGLFADVSSISLFGSQTFMLTLIGYTVGLLQGKINAEKPIAQMSLVLMMSLAYLLGLLFFEALFGYSIQRFKVKTSFFQPVYSTLISPLLFSLLLRWSCFFHNHEMKWLKY